VNYTVLLVEDDENIMKINETLLSKAGYRILKAATLRAAEAVLETVEPDIIVLDILLPDGNGINWCEKIRGGI
jgi:DNA-binding response OmpR family regulator